MNIHALYVKSFKKRMHMVDVKNVLWSGFKLRLLIDLDDSILIKVDDLKTTLKRSRKQTIQLIIENYFIKNTFEKTSIDLGAGKIEQL